MTNRRSLAAAVALSAVLSFSPLATAADAGGPRLKLEKGDHISIIGNTLADRMQHHGWMETLIYNAFPDQELVFRNLGFAGDEVAVTPTTRQRTDGFGSPDQWLTRTKADVVFAFFGYNESYAGEAGLDKFKKDLTKFIKDTQGKQYDGKSAPRLVLFSPIAFENHHTPNLPDGAAQNKNLKLYADAMAEAAKANNVPFVDLFTPSQELYAKAAKPLTINGVHLNESGDKALAPAIVKGLFPDAPADKAKADAAAVEKLHAAVQDKNFYWFERYRVLDGYNVYGGRADLKYTNDLSNRTVMDREMEVLDVMTANRDPKVWAAAQGKDYRVNDDNTPPFIPVKTNLPGKGPNGEHLFLSGEEELKHIKTAPGVKVNLFASEEQFPDLISAVQMAWDTKGRLWVATWPTYPHWKPKSPMNDKLIILEDTDGDGKADKCTTFADNLHCPTGFEFYKGGVLVAQAPGIEFLKDTNGDDKADVVERVLEGLDSGDSHHTSNSFTFDPGGALYFQEGTFHHTQVETPYGPTERVANGAVFRYEPVSQKFEVYASFGFANPHGHVFDSWGTDIVTDGTGAQPYYGPSFSGKTYFPQKHAKTAPVVYKQRTRPCPGTEILSSRVFPDEYQGNLLVPNVIGFQGILNYKLTESGSGLVGKEVEPLLRSDDPNFRPADLEIGPDGAIYFTDWHNPVIGHMQHHLRDPSRDHSHGRVYRVTYEGRPLLKPAKIAGEPVEKLLDLLKEPENRVRYRAKIELSNHDAKEVIPAVEKWIAGLDKNGKDYQHQLTEALWMYQWNNVVNEPLLKQQLRSSDPNARAAATRVLCYWRDRVKEPLALLKVQATDDSPRVRLEAVRACSFFQTPEAAEVALESVNKPDDMYLKYTLEETLKTLERFTKGK